MRDWIPRLSKGHSEWAFTLWDTMPIAANGTEGEYHRRGRGSVWGESHVLYTVTKPNGQPYRWSDVCEGWADYPIFLRRESDACDVARILEEKFGTSCVKRLGTPRGHRHEKIPERMDSLDIQLALWIAESKARRKAS